MPRFNPVRLFIRFVQLWRIGPRLVISYAVLLVLMLALAGVALYCTNAIHARLDAVVQTLHEAMTGGGGAAAEQVSRLDQLVKVTSESSDRTAGLLRTSILVLVGLAGVFGFIPAYIITRSVTEPVAAVADVVGRAAGGDLREGFTQRLSDEVGQLAAGVNVMIENMRGLMREIQIAAAQVQGVSAGLAASADGVGASSEQVARTVEQLARGAEEQAASATVAGHTAETMAESVRAINADLDGMVSRTAGASAAAESGRHTVDAAVRQMQSIQDTVEGAAQVVRELGERSREIGTIVDTISGISDQTNMLALNAAIEAARAGEQGRGFAVVADEVRKLADQSKQAADRIGTLIQDIQGNTERAVRAIELGTEAAARGSESVAESGEAFREIGAAVAAVTEEIRGLARMAVLTGTESQKAVEAVESIAAVTEQAAAGAQEVSAAAEEQAAQVKEIAGAARSLAELATKLNVSLSRFQV